MLKLDVDKEIHQERIEPNEILSGNTLEKDLIKKFNSSIIHIKEKFSLLDFAISEELKLNILRGQVSLLLSAVDFYIHEIIKIELLNIIKGERKKTPSLKNCMISVETFLEYLSSLNTNNQIFEDEIIYRNSFKSFLEPDKMAEALSLITEKKIFKELFSELGLLKTKELKDKIKEIFRRRNSIVHQMDYDYSTRSQQVITREEVESYIEFYDKFIQKLHILLLKKNI